MSRKALNASVGSQQTFRAAVRYGGSDHLQVPEGIVMNIMNVDVGHGSSEAAAFWAFLAFM